MAITVPHQIYSPDEGSPGNMVTQLGLMATSINNSLQTIPVKHITDNALGQTFFGTGDNAIDNAGTFLGMSPEADSYPLAAWIATAGGVTSRFWKNGDMSVTGKFIQTNDTGWVNCTRASGISAQGSLEPQVRRHLGRVYFQWGHSATGISTNTSVHVFTVPVGFRPPAGNYFQVAGSNGLTSGRANIMSDGQVFLSTTGNVGSYYIYDNVSYFLE